MLCEADQWPLENRIFARPKGQRKLSSITWVTSYPKSGNTWLRVMLAAYRIDGPIEALDVLADHVPNFSVMLGEGRLLPTDSPTPLTVKTHFVPSRPVLQWYREAADKVVYVVRNPRDIIFSAARQLNIREEKKPDFARHFVANDGLSIWEESGWGTWPQHVREWTELDQVRQYFPAMNVLVVRYEDMRADPGAELYKVLDFLKLDDSVDSARVERAVRNSSLEKMREVEKRERNREYHTWVNTSRNQYFGEQFFGQGLSKQSLAGLGADIEESYQQLLNSDGDFARCAKRFGYDA